MALHQRSAITKPSGNNTNISANKHASCLCQIYRIVFVWNRQVHLQHYQRGHSTSDMRRSHFLFFLCHAHSEQQLYFQGLITGNQICFCKFLATAEPKGHVHLDKCLYACTDQKILFHVAFHTWIHSGSKPSTYPCDSCSKTSW